MSRMNNNLQVNLYFIISLNFIIDSKEMNLYIYLVSIIIQFLILINKIRINLFTMPIIYYDNHNISRWKLYCKYKLRCIKYVD